MTSRKLIILREDKPSLNKYIGDVVDVLPIEQFEGKEVTLDDTADIVWTATGGQMGPFRYAAAYNATNGLLISYYDRGTTLTLEDGETYTADIPAVLFDLQ